jgi:hypothetical protein
VAFGPTWLKNAYGVSPEDMAKEMAEESRMKISAVSTVTVRVRPARFEIEVQGRVTQPSSLEQPGMGSR